MGFGSAMGSTVLSPGKRFASASNFALPAVSDVDVSGDELPELVSHVGPRWELAVTLHPGCKERLPREGGTSGEPAAAVRVA